MWQDIKTAPEEGHMLICFENRSVFYAYRILGRWFWGKGTPLYAHRKITHWMPFPEPPRNDTP